MRVTFDFFTRNRMIKLKIARITGEVDSNVGDH